MTAGRLEGDFWPRAVGFVPPGAASEAESASCEEVADAEMPDAGAIFGDSMSGDEGLDPGAAAKASPKKPGRKPTAKGKAKARASKAKAKVKPLKRPAACGSADGESLKKGKAKAEPPKDALDSPSTTTSAKPSSKAKKAKDPKILKSSSPEAKKAKAPKTPTISSSKAVKTAPAVKKAPGAKTKDGSKKVPKRVRVLGEVGCSKCRWKGCRTCRELAAAERAAMDTEPPARHPDAGDTDEIEELE